MNTVPSNTFRSMQLTALRISLEVLNFWQLDVYGHKAIQIPNIRRKLYKENYINERS